MKTAAAAAPPRLVLAGATGLIGRELLRQALQRPDLRALHALVRKAPADGPQDPRLFWHRVDFAALPAGSDFPAADAALCALGTTIKVAGSQAAFRAVDHDAVLAFASAAFAAGVRHFGVVSALGADAASGVFYNRVKGEAEAALEAIGFSTLVIAQPSLLLGDRARLGQPTRSGERLVAMLTAPLAPLIPAAWRPIDAAVVARALLRTTLQGAAGVMRLPSKDLQALGRA